VWPALPPPEPWETPLTAGVEVGYVLPEAMDSFATIVYPDGSRVALTANDLLWTARMVRGEGGANVTSEEAAAIIWTLIQRRWWGTGMPTANPRAFAGYRTWTSFIQTFSQPINPIWRRDGSRCAGRPQTGDCATAKLALRDRYASMPWTDPALTEVIRTAVELLARGSLQNNVPGVVDFRANDGQAAAILASDPARSAAAVTSGMQNVYFYSRTGSSRVWAGSGIYLEPPIPADSVTMTFASLVPGADRYIAALTGRAM